jgi:hypothetical protein
LVIEASVRVPIGSGVDRVVGRFSILEFRFSKSANWFTLPPETTDNRSGGVWALRMNVNARIVSCRFLPRRALPFRTARLSTFSLCLALPPVAYHSPFPYKQCHY